MKVSFTKPVDLPEDILEIIKQNLLVNITFVPSTYDTDDEEIDKSELESWTFKGINKYGMDFKLDFKNPNLLSYSIFDSD